MVKSKIWGFWGRNPLAGLAFAALASECSQNVLVDMKNKRYAHRVWPKDVHTVHNMMLAMEAGHLDVRAHCYGNCPRNLLFKIPFKLLSGAHPAKRYTLMGKQLPCPVYECPHKCNVLVKINNLTWESISVHEPPPYWKLG